ncbi:MAG: hypothetical protein ACUVQ5_03725 [Candidatus Methanomethylicaceae archaeon]
MPEKKFLGHSKGIVRENEAVPAFEDFIAEEMCLASAGYPVSCADSSKWRIVEKLWSKAEKIIHARIKGKAAC